MTTTETLITTPTSDPAASGPEPVKGNRAKTGARRSSKAGAQVVGERGSIRGQAKRQAKQAKEPKATEPKPETAKERTARERAERERRQVDEAKRTALCEARDRLLLAAEALAKAPADVLTDEDRELIRGALDQLKPLLRTGRSSSRTGGGSKGIATWCRERFTAGATVEQVAAELPERFPGTGAARNPKGYARFYAKK